MDNFKDGATEQFGVSDYTQEDADKFVEDVVVEVSSVPYNNLPNSTLEIKNPIDFVGFLDNLTTYTYPQKIIEEYFKDVSIQEIIRLFQFIVDAGDFISALPDKKTICFRGVPFIGDFDKLAIYFSGLTPEECVKATRMKVLGLIKFEPGGVQFMDLDLSNKNETLLDVLASVGIYFSKRVSDYYNLKIDNEK